MSDIIVGNIYQINQNIPIPNGTLNKNTLVKALSEPKGGIKKKLMLK